MANDETPRFRWPFPAWDADWQKWQDVFGDLVNNIDATVFSSVDGSRLIFKSIPSAEIVSNGPGYDLVMNGNLVMQSRAHGVEITIPAGTYSLTALAVAAMTSTPGAVGSQLISWEMIEGGVSASPDVVPMGYVDASYNITWWNGAQLTAGGSAVPLFGSASGGSGGGSLNEAYVLGGSITANAGAVTITNAVDDATNTLELTRSGTATGSPLHITNDLDGFQAEARSTIFMTGTGRQNIWSDKELYIGSSVQALGVYLKNVAAGTSLLRVQSEATGATGDGTTWVTASGAGDGTGYLLLQASGAGTGAETRIDIKASAGSTGPGHVDITASGGSAYVLVGAGACAVRLDDENRAASTWTQAYIPLSDVSTEWDDLESNCSGEVSLIQAINLAFDGKAKWTDGTVEDIAVASGGGTAIGSIDISCNQGLVSELLAYVQTGSTDDVDVELGDASFSGSPNVLYQIGQNESLEGLWVPDTNGNWKDRNAWGFKGLTAGLLYYRFTNNGANAITMGILVDVIGKV